MYLLTSKIVGEHFFLARRFILAKPPQAQSDVSLNKRSFRSFLRRRVIKQLIDDIHVREQVGNARACGFPFT